MQCIWRQDRSTGLETWSLFNIGLCFEPVETRRNSDMKSLCRKNVIFLTVSFQDRSVQYLWVWRWHPELFVQQKYTKGIKITIFNCGRGYVMCQCPVRFCGRRPLVAAAISSKWGAGTLDRYVGLSQRVLSQNPDWNGLEQDGAHTLYISVYLCFVSLGLGHANTRHTVCSPSLSSTTAGIIPQILVLFNFIRFSLWFLSCFLLSLAISVSEVVNIG